VPGRDVERGGVRLDVEEAGAVDEIDAAEEGAAGAAVGVGEQQLVTVLRPEALGGDDPGRGAGALPVGSGLDECGSGVHGDVPADRPGHTG
jgi:hypothetical protein